MTPDRWKKIEDLFQSALDLEGAARDDFIRAECGADDELRAEVEKLVARYETEENFLESPVWTDSAVLGNTLKKRVAESLENEIPPTSVEKSFAGRKVGAYLLTEQIGRGGMGVVYAAERADGEFSQKTAVKLIKRGMDTDFIVRRFRHERQILASLNHPNIARLLDGGTTADDLPYFIMEFIEGEPFLKYCAKKKLDLRRRLELFLEVCAAVHYAHRRKIIHRDIKPSNILVTNDGTPKLLDFGIAKLLDPDSIHESLVPTATAMRLMTPEYASPEQVRGDAITPASDQYSLGVLLYELITGNRPYKFASRAPHEIARVICEEVPSEPSSGSFETGLAGTGDSGFDADFCKNLDRVVLKALRKDPAERYASVDEFTADIERFLRSETVRAESFAIESALIEVSPATGENRSNTPITARRTGENLDRENPQTAQTVEKSGSPRWRGVKQGVFLTTLSLLLTPVYLILIVTDFIPPAITISAFLLLLVGGLIRILYALLFEPGKAAAGLATVNESAADRVSTGADDDFAPVETRSAGKITAGQPAEHEKSIAVLPFRDLNAAGETTGDGEFLSVGLADALITRLSNVKQLLVRPTSSVLRFGSESGDAFAAGEELKAAYILTGSVVRADSKIRVSIQLLDVKKRATVWAQRFDEELTDVLEIEDSISASVVESLLPALTGEERKRIEKRGTENAAAYEFYLRGRFHWNSFTEDGFAKAFAAYQKAIEKDENYALAYAGIADYYIWLGVYGVLEPKECYAAAKEAARRAIEIDDGLAEAHASLGFAALCGDYDWIEAEKHTARAIGLNPNYTVARLWHSYVLQSAGRFEAGIDEARRAVELDPFTYTNRHVLAWALYFARNFDEALKTGERNIRNFPSIGLGYFTHSWLLRFLGRHDEALQTSQKALDLSGGSLFVLLGHGQALAAAGRRAETREILQKIFEQGKSQYLSYYQVALIYAYEDENEKALDALERAFAEREGWLIWLKTEPALDRLRGESRFIALREKVERKMIGAAGEFSPARAENVQGQSAAVDRPSYLPEKREHGSIARRFWYVPVIAAAALLLYFAIARFGSHPPRLDPPPEAPSAPSAPNVGAN